MGALSRRGLLIGAGAAGAASLLVRPGQALAVSSNGHRFVPVAPRRLYDTRLVASLPAGGQLDVTITGQPGVPAVIGAAVLNVTAVGAAGPGYVTVWPSGTARPVVSNLNPVVGETAANLVTVGVGADGKVSIFVYAACDIVVDLFGVYEPVVSSRSGRFQPYGPTRLLDTRKTTKVAARGTVRVPLPAGVPSDAVGLVLNLTATEATGDGFLTAMAAGAPLPDTSNLDVSAGGTRSNQVIVPASPNGVDIYSMAGAHVVVDISGYFTGASASLDTAGLFVPLAPTRLVDTRLGGSLNPLGTNARMQPRWVLEMPVAGRAGVPASAVAAIVGNTTVIDANNPGYVTAYPAGSGLPGVSTVNANARGQTIPNHTVVPISARGVDFSSYSGCHLAFDIAGYFTGAAGAAVLPVPTNAPVQAGAFPGTLRVPALGLSVTVGEGIGDAVLAVGPGHWPGSGSLGLGSNVAVFGHRVSHTHPFHYLNLLVVGDSVEVETATVLVRYQVVQTWVTGANDISIIGATGSAVITMVACHPPGSITYRIVVRAQQVDLLGL